VIIISYALMDEKESRSHKPKIILIDENNKIRKVK